MRAQYPWSHPPTIEPPVAVAMEGGVYAKETL